MKECDLALSSMIDVLCLYSQNTRDTEMEEVTRNQEETRNREETREQEDIQEKEDRDQQLIEEAFTYRMCGIYPEEATDRGNRKRVIRKKALKFEVENGELLYKMKHKVS